MWKCLPWNHSIVQHWGKDHTKKTECHGFGKVFRGWILGKYQGVHIREALINEKIVGSCMERYQASTIESP